MISRGRQSTDSAGRSARVVAIDKKGAKEAPACERAGEHTDPSSFSFSARHVEEISAVDLIPPHSHHLFPSPLWVFFSSQKFNHEYDYTTIVLLFAFYDYGL